MRARFTCAWGGRPSYRCRGTAFSFRSSPLGRWVYLGWPTPCWPSNPGSLAKSPLVMISEPSICLLIERVPTSLLCMWVLAGERSIDLTRAPFTCGHIGHAFWTYPLKITGVGMGSPRVARIIGFLGCTQFILIYSKSFQVFAVWILFCAKNAEMINLNICKEKIDLTKKINFFFWKLLFLYHVDKSVAYKSLFFK